MPIASKHAQNAQVGRKARWISRAPSLIPLLGALWLTTHASCLLITDRSKDQCATDAECVAKGAAFANTQCVQGVCISNTASAGECTKNADCLSNQQTPNTYCSAQNACLPIVNTLCTSIITSDGGPIPPDAIVLGVMSPLSGDNAPEGQARVNGVKLAYAEFIERAIGIPTANATVPRPLALVVCDQVADVEAAARHLTDDVKVPAIIGPAFSGATVKVAKNVTIPSGTLLVTPSATTPDLTTLQDDGLVWRTSSSFEPESKAYAALLAQFETNAKVRAALELSDTAPLRVAVVAKGDSYGKGLADSLSSTLTFNGNSAAANGPTYFARIDFPDFSANPNADTQPQVSSVVQTFKPHVILMIGTAELITRGLEPIEEQWVTGSGAQARPFYFFSEGAKLGQLITAVAASEASHPDRKLMSRLQTFGPRYNNQLFELMQTRYAAANNNAPMPDVYGLTGSYDAFYLLTYALTASGTFPPTGKSIATGLARTVPPGTTIAAGPSDLSRGLAELIAGRNIDYDGVTGKLDFDITTGESAGDYNLYCVRSSQFVERDQYFVSSELRLVGDYQPCE